MLAAVCVGGAVDPAVNVETFVLCLFATLAWGCLHRGVRSGCAGGPIQYYGEANHQHQPAKTGATAPTTFTSRYCGVEAYWQLKPGQLRNLISSVSP